MKSRAGRSRMSVQERRKRRAAIGKDASEKVAKSEQLNFRISEEDIRELQDLALKKGLPVGAMVRGWVHERLVLEKMDKPEISMKALLILDEIYAKLNSLFSSVA